MILFAELYGKLKEEEEILDVVSDQSSIVSLTNSRDCQNSKLYAEVRLLRCDKLLFPIDFIEVRGTDSALLKSALIEDGAHDLTFPVIAGLAVLKPIVEVQEGPSVGVTVEEVPY